MLAALNGVLGDYLLASGNPRAISMGLRHAGAALAIDRAALAAAQGRPLLRHRGESAAPSIIRKAHSWRRAGGGRRALGLHRDVSLSPALPEGHRWAGYEMGHFDLLSSHAVYEQILRWLADDRQG